MVPQTSVCASRPTPIYSFIDYASCFYAGDILCATVEVDYNSVTNINDSIGMTWEIKGSSFTRLRSIPSKMGREEGIIIWYSGPHILGVYCV